jgi:hypothetical protein
MKKRNYHKIKHTHKQPFLIRHFVYVTLGLILLTITGWQLMFLPKNIPSVAPDSSASEVSEQIVIQSDFGFMLPLNTEQLSIAATKKTKNQTTTAVSESQISQEPRINNVVIRPKNPQNPRHAASELSISVHTEKETTTNSIWPHAKFLPQNDEDFTVQLLSTDTEYIGGAIFTKYTHALNSKRNPKNDNKLYEITWVNYRSDTWRILRITGITGAVIIPDTYSSVLSSIQFETQQTAANTLAEQTPQPTKSYLDQLSIDKYSPAMVQLYSTTCGTISAPLLTTPIEHCQYRSSNGFFVSGDGLMVSPNYLVDTSWASFVVDGLIRSPTIMQPLLINYFDFSSEEAQLIEQRPRLLARAIDAVYNTQNAPISVDPSRQDIIAVIGKNVPSDSSLKNPSQIKGSDEIITITYLDSVTLPSAEGKNFISSSRQSLALLKSTTSMSTPRILANQKEYLEQNEMGYVLSLTPINQKLQTNVLPLQRIETTTPRQTLHYTLTLKEAPSYSLIGSVLMNHKHQAIGIITSTTKKDNDTFLIEAIDVSVVLSSQKITGPLQTSSMAQSKWEHGLDQYRKRYYTAAIQSFQETQQQFRGHRLADSYITNAQYLQQEGKEQTTPESLLISGAFGGIGGMLIGGTLLTRHRYYHRAYKDYLASNPNEGLLIGPQK